MPRFALAVVVWIAGCNARSPKADKPPEVAVKPAAAAPAPAPAATPAGDAFCARRFDEADAPAWRWPTLATPAPAESHRWRWVNLWASWCPPCLDEAPRMVAWHDKLVAAGKPIDLTLIALDDSDAVVSRVKAANPQFPATLRLADHTGGEDLSEPVMSWIGDMVHSDAVSLPLHALVSPGGKLRCVHVGGLDDKDYDALAAQIAP